MDGEVDIDEAVKALRGLRKDVKKYEEGTNAAKRRGFNYGISKAIRALIEVSNQEK